MSVNSIEQPKKYITNYENIEVNLSRSPSQIMSPLRVSPKSTLNADLAVTLTVLKDFDNKTTRDIFKHNSFTSALE